MEKKQLTDGSMALQEKQCRVITIEATLDTPQDGGQFPCKPSFLVETGASE